MSSNASGRYDPVSQIFHWVTALAVLVAFILGPEGFGRLMHQGVDPATRADIVWHESLGVLVFVLTLVRLLWVALRPSTPTFEMSRGMHIVSKATHGVLWLMLLATPVTAMLTLGTEGYPLTLLGGVRVNELTLIANSGLGDVADWGDVHSLLGDAILWLAGLHAAAAIFHHVFLKDGVLASMSPFGRSN
jgi:cytochrome b561